MEELIKEFKPNANKKYYLFMASYIQKMIAESNPELSMSVDKIIENNHISKPTFYTYFSNTEHFYKELLEMVAYVLPFYMRNKSAELNSDDMLEVAYQMRIGVIVQNIKKASDMYSSLSSFWKTYYWNAVTQVSGWYVREFEMEPENAKFKARFVLNELILHPDLYYKDFDTYRSLMIDQRTAHQVA